MDTTAETVRAGLTGLLDGGCAGLRVEALDTATSTNALVRARAAAGEPEGLVIVAMAQSAGRGRGSRSFFSPPGTGIYWSLLLRPAGLTPQRAVRITTMAAVAVCEAIEAVSGGTPGIKWVNDVFVRGRKVCGILTEGVTSPGTGLLDCAVLGVGVNVYRPSGGFPPDIADKAGSVFAETGGDAGERIAAGFLNSFMRLYSAADSGAYAAEYRRRSLAIGRRITVLRPDAPVPATALDIDGECRLLVRYDDGREEYLSSGEISILL